MHLSRLTKESIEQMNESDFRSLVLTPLLKAMNYKGVFEWHGGPGELGKDIVCWHIDPLSQTRRNLAIVAKAKRPTTNPALKDIAEQVAQALNHPFLEPSTQEKMYVNEVWIVVNKRLPKETRGRIDASLGREHLRSRVIKDIDQIWDHVQEHLKTTVQLADETAQRLKELNTKFRVNLTLDESGTRRLTIGEKYPGQSQSEPLEGKLDFVFPDTPEARTKLEELQRSIETGSEVVIPEEYIREFGIPHEFSRILEAVFGVTQTPGMSLRISSAPDTKPRLLSFDLIADDGERASLPFIELRVVQAGTDQLTLDNREQAIPILVTMTVDFKALEFNVNFTTKKVPMPVSWLLTTLGVVNCLHKPGHITITSLDSGLPLSKRRHPGFSTGYAADSAFKKMVADLVAIQTKVIQPIIVPRRDFTTDEVETIDLLRRVLHHGEVTGTWTNMEATWLWTKEEMEEALSRFADGTGVRTLRTEEEQTYDLFGSVLPLGKVVTVYAEARLINAQEIREQFTHVDGDEQIEVEARIEPGDDKSLATTYLDWIEPRDEHTDS